MFDHIKDAAVDMEMGIWLRGSNKNYTVSMVGVCRVHALICVIAKRKKNVFFLSTLCTF